MEKENIFFFEEKKNRERKGGKYLWKISPKIVKDIEKSCFGHDLGGLGTFANFWRVTVSASENLVSEKNLGFGFGKFVIRKKVSVSVSVKILVSSFSASHPIHPSALNELNRPKIDLQ